MKKPALFIFLSLILFNEISYSQGTFFKNYDGIPIIANLWGREHNLFPGYNYQDIQDAGIDAVISVWMNDTIYNLLKPKSKIIPYQCFPSGRFGTVFYSERGYTLWEAEDDDISHLTLERSNVVYRQEPNPNGGEVIKYVRSNINVIDTIIYGPKHYNQLRESIIDFQKIPYTALFRIKLVNKADSSLNSLCNQGIDVCKLKVISSYEEDNTTKYFVLSERVLKDTEFKNLNNWITCELPYNSSTDIECDTTTFEKKLIGNVKHWKYIKNVEFKIIWLGSTTFNLCVDNIELYDEDGKKLVENEGIAFNRLTSEVNYQLDPFMSDADVVGWYPVDEPNFIDNMACVKKVAEVVETQKPNNDIIPTIAGSQTGLLDYGSNYSKINEFYYRAGYQGAKINTYIYNYPFQDDDPNFIQKNINYLLNHLSMANKKDTAFISSIQTGRFDVENTGTLDITPSRAQFLYNINTALLYGARAIEMSNYYYHLGGENLRTALIGVSENGSTNDITYSELWGVLKNEISPRLHGDYGKLLKILNQNIQDALTTNLSSIISNPKFSKITNNSDFDCGTFCDKNNKRYAMAVSRWYNSDNNKIQIDYERLKYINYTIHEYYNSIDSSKYAIDEKLTLYRTLNPGEAFLYEIKPALFYGGKLLLDESVTINIELTGALEITSGKALKIADTCTYTISGELYARNGSSICSDHKGDIIFSGSGKYRHETWGNSLFYLAKGGHPKLVWGSLQGNQTYGVYRKSGTTYLLIATIYSTDNNIKQSYIDSSITIYNGQLAGSEVYYKISRISGGRTYFTNEVSVTISNQSMEKQNVFIKEFAIEQNYPNPFNGITSIKYMIPESGIVRIKIFDILGREIKFFNEGEKEVGMYEFKFNSGELSSGIYIYSVQHNNKILSKKMLLMK